MEMVKINNRDVERIEYRGNPVVTLRMVDELHERPSGTARKRFNDNKEHFLEGEDYFRVPYAEWSTFQMSEFRTSENSESKQHAPVIFITQSGYLMLVKSFTDDLAWKVQRELVNAYFRLRQQTHGTDMPHMDFYRGIYDKALDIRNPELADFMHTQIMKEAGMYSGFTQSAKPEYREQHKETQPMSNMPLFTETENHESIPAKHKAVCASVKKALVIPLTDRKHLYAKYGK